MQRSCFIWLLVVFAVFTSPLIAYDNPDSLRLALMNAGNDSTRLRLTVELGDYYAVSEAYEQADTLYKKALVYAADLESDLYRTIVLDKLGTLFRKQGQFKKSLQYHLDALEIATENRYSKQLPSIYNNIGVAYRRLSEDEKALEYHLEALQHALETNNHRIESYSYNSIGIIYTYQQHYEEALDYFNRALSLAEKLDNQTGIAINLNSIAWVYELQENYPEAISFYLRSLEVNEQMDNQEGIAICYNDLGKIYRTIGEHEVSLDYYRKTLDINEREGDKRYIAITRINMGQVLGDMGEYDRSLDELHKGLSYALQLRTRRLIMEAYKELSVTHEHLNQYREALRYNKLAESYRDSIYSDENSRQIAELKTAYETEVKEQENRALAAEKETLDRVVRSQRQIGIVIIFFMILGTSISIYLVLIRKKLIQSQKQISSQNKQLLENEKKLNEVLSSRDKFFKIIAHDLKNHFNIIIGYSDLLAYGRDKLTNEERETMTREVAEMSQNTYNLLENLLLWARNQTEGVSFEPAPVDLRKIIEHVISSLHAHAREKNISVVLKLESPITIHADEEMLKTVFRNLISNAIKFSEKGGKVEIGASVHEQSVQITVRDSGTGISPEKQKHLFDLTRIYSTPGTENEKGTGLGLLLCKEFIDLHRGNIHLESEPGKGTTFYVDLPR